MQVNYFQKVPFVDDLMEKVDADTVLSAVLSSRTFHSNNLIKWQTKGTKGEEIYIFSEMVDFKSFMFFS